MSFEPEKPSPARIYDYFLVGYHTFSVCSQAVEQITTVFKP
jgi:hypothetical protein